MTNDLFNKVAKYVEVSRNILIVQADNPDADSLGSALAIEQILGNIGKEPYLYCAVDMPSYLHYLDGWSRVNKELPPSYDLVIIVDCSTNVLLEKISKDPNFPAYRNAKKIVLDHHAITEDPIDAAVTINMPELSSTGEVIFKLCQHLGYEIDDISGYAIMAAILGDTQGLSNDLASPQTFRCMAELLELGVNRVQLEEKRRAESKYDPKIYAYKSDLIKRTKLTDDGIAYIEIPQTEINQFSALYNPAALIQPEMLQIQGIHLSIVFKTYDDGKVTAAIRSNSGAPIAGELAKAMGGGGHQFASGFKVNDKPFSTIKSDCLSIASEMIMKRVKENK